MTSYLITFVTNESDAAPTENADIVRLLRKHNRERIEDRNFPGVTVIVRDEEGTVKGGCVGRAYRGWLEIQYLVVAPEQRRLGYGAKLLAAIEAETMRRTATARFSTPSVSRRARFTKNKTIVCSALWKISRQDTSGIS